MASATNAFDGQSFVTTVAESSPELRVSLLTPVLIYNYPAEHQYSSQSFVTVVAESDTTSNVSQSYVVVIYRGRVENHKVRVWAFSLDGHDFYVVTLGEDTTLVYDLTTDTWSEWSTHGYDTWRAQRGINWISMGADTYEDQGAQTNVVAGDNNYGLLWTLNPEVGYDEDPVTSDEVQIDRKLIGGLQQKLRETVQVGGAYVLASSGSPQLSGAAITLRTSDDLGNTWTNHGTITTEISNFTQEFVWRSLGLIRAPGRLFEITDNGATVRIDSLDIR